MLIQTSALSFGEKNNGAFPYLSLQVSFKSRFSDFSKFLDGLENSPFVLEIQNLNVRKIGDEVSVSFPLKVFTK